MEDDLLPIVYLHCDWSLKIGEGAKMVYNLNEIERRFMEKVCYGKCFLQVVVRPFCYHDNVNNAKHFIDMRKRIKQVSMIRGIYHERCIGRLAQLVLSLIHI